MWAAGNGGINEDSCASDGYVNSIYTIAIGSVNEKGEPAYYDEECSAKMAVTFHHHSNPYSSLHVVSSNLENSFFYQRDQFVTCSCVRNLGGQENL